MKPLHLVLSAGLAISSVSGAAEAQTAAKKPAPQHAAAAVPAGKVEPGALQALQRMSAYMRTLTEFEIKATTSTDLVLDDGEKVAQDAVNTYTVHRPDGFMIETTSDQRVRQFFYNGKQFTLAAPELGYYATVPAPPTIRQTLDAVTAKYDIKLPLDDLFSWSDPASDRAKDLKSGFLVGTATLHGVKTDHYAFRSANVDWQIWIAQGDQPLPLKVMMIDRLDGDHPAFTANLDWNTKPSIQASNFTYAPGPNAKAIHIASTGK